MADKSLDRPTIALLLAIYATHGKERPATEAVIRKSLADVIPAETGISVKQEAATLISAALTADLIAPVQTNAKGSVQRFKLTDTGLAQLERSIPRPLKRGTWASLRDGTLMACTLPKPLAAQNIPFGHLRAIVIAESLGYEARIAHAKTESAVLNMIAAGTLEARNASHGNIRLARLRRWIARDKAALPGAAASQPSAAVESSRSEAPRREASDERTQTNGSPVSLQAFATAVRAAAARAEGRFGRKAFINRVWQALVQEPAVRGLDLAGFRKRLVDANRHGLIRLSRADLVDALPPEDVRESAVRILDDDVHFIEVER